MSPDIEWHVGEDAEQETIAKTTPPRRSRRRWIAVLIVVILGAGLGMAYRSIPEPHKPPAPTPTMPSPTATPAPPSLDEAIRRDVYALASRQDTDGVTFDPSLSLMPQAYADWYAALQNTDGGWGPVAPLTPYMVFETGLLPSGIAWAKMGQFRNNDFFRQTRFYRWRNDRWEWTLPDWTFWSGEVHTRTFASPWSYPFTIDYPVEDKALIPTVGDRFARALAYLCSSLNCPPNPSESSAWSQSITLTIVVDPYVQNFHMVQAQAKNLTITMPSLRVVGYYENPNRPGDPLNAIVYDSLIDPITQLASGDYQRWSHDRGGEVFLQAIADWQRAHIDDVVHPSNLFFHAPARAPKFELLTTTPQIFYAAMLRAGPSVPLSSLWDWSPEDTRFGLLQTAAQTEAESVVYFMQERYGQAGLIRFLIALGKSTSLAEALEAGLQVKFGEFNRQWMTWIAAE